MSKFRKLSEDESIFLEKYEKLCLEYGMYVGGCGCCDSPFLINVSKTLRANISDIGKNVDHLKITTAEN